MYIDETWGGEVSLWINELKGLRFKCNHCLKTMIINKFKGMMHPSGLKDRLRNSYLVGAECQCGAFFDHLQLKSGGY